MRSSIGQGRLRSSEIAASIRQAPLPAIRQLLTDRRILDVCCQCRHTFRERRFGPVVTVLHFVAAALKREDSFASTWQELMAPVAVDHPELELKDRDDSSLTHARGRLPVKVMQFLARQSCEDTREVQEEHWRGHRLRALDVCTVSMPDEKPLHEHYGTHRVGAGKVRYPLATFAALLNVGNSLFVDYRFGPYDAGELKTVAPLLSHLDKGDLLLADLRYAGAPFLARTLARQADFLVLKHQLLKVEDLPVLKRLGKNDFVTELSINKNNRKADASLPEKITVRVFQASITTPAGEKITEWYVTSLLDARKYTKHALARLYHLRWRIETSYLDFKQTFGADVLRSKTVDNVEKELAGHVLAYQLVRLLIAAAARKHHKPANQISLLNAARSIEHVSHLMQASPTGRLPELYERLLDLIACCMIDVRPARLEPRQLSRQKDHYSMRKISRSQWREQRLNGNRST